MAVRRIKYAYYDPAWDNTTMSLAALTRTEVGPLEYTSEMRGHLHCPSCYESLIRVPKDPSISVMAHNREALFRHLPDTDHTAPQCLLRSGIMVGKKYNSEAEALQAIEDEDIIIISGFMQERANNNARDPAGGEDEQVETDYESEDGPAMDVPISRHEGQTFNVPSKITSVMSLCSNFRRNFYRDIHILVDGEVKHYVLSECLTDAADIAEENDTPNFYFGEIVSFRRFDHTSHVFLRHPRLAGNVDFRISASNEDLDARGITAANAQRRILVFFGKIESVGAGYWSQNKKWGEIALLPEKYEDFLRANSEREEE